MASMSPPVGPASAPPVPPYALHVPCMECGTVQGPHRSSGLPEDGFRA